MIAGLKGVMWWILSVLAALAGFLFMLLRLRAAKDQMHHYRREAKTRAEKARVTEAAAEAGAQVRQEAAQHERQEDQRHDAGDRPTGSFGDRLRDD